MSCQNDFLAIQPREQRCLLDSSSSQRVGSSTRTRHLRICSSTYSYSSQADPVNTNLLDPLNDITLDSDLDQRTASSTTLLSRVSLHLYIRTNP